ncbi:MAG TPA: hypothetical protein VNE82_12725, partial [Candidatus Binataceae bacterium]|nr:hypothetical protein [Candidatus Binataceae bacterium]
MKEADGADLVVVVVAMADRDRQRSKAKNQTGARPRGAAAASSRLFPAAASAALPRASQPPANGARAFSPYAALLRDERDAERPVVGTTWGGTICWSPRKPSKLAAVSSDGRSEHVIRCGECAGCREFFRRRQARRLHALYGDGKREVWILEVAVSIGEQSALCERMNRTRLLSGVSGFFRLSPREIALIVVGPKPRPAAVRML